MKWSEFIRQVRESVKELELNNILDKISKKKKVNRL